MERNEFSLDYQAKLDLKTRAITGVEALLRWNNPYLGVGNAHSVYPDSRRNGNDSAYRQMGYQNGLRPERCLAETGTSSCLHGCKFIAQTTDE